MADTKLDAVEEARRRALQEEQDRENNRDLSAQERDERMRRSVERRNDPTPELHDFPRGAAAVSARREIDLMKIDRAERENPMAIPPGIPGSPGQPTDPPIDPPGADPAQFPIAADDEEALAAASEEIENARQRALAARPVAGLPREEVGEVIDRSVPPEDLAETNEGRAEARRLHEEAAREEDEARKAREEAEEKAREAERKAQEKTNEKTERATKKNK